MPKIKVLVEGVHKEIEPGILDIGSTVVLIQGEKNIIVDPGAFGDREKVIGALKAEGLTPDDIDLVILTHVHLDHVVNAGLFPNVPIYLKFAQHYMGMRQTLAQKKLEKCNLEENTEIISGVKIILTPGHSWDCLAVVVETEEGICVVSGDALASEEYANLAKKPFAPVVYSMDLFDQSRQKILKIADYVIPGHGKMFKVKK